MWRTSRFLSSVAFDSESQERVHFHNYGKVDKEVSYSERKSDCPYARDIIHKGLGACVGATNNLEGEVLAPAEESKRVVRRAKKRQADGRTRD
jgi:hypothetical protein